MTSDLEGLVDASVRPRSSTSRSTGLDYASCDRVDEDIISRIRALILSRNDSRPPITPNNSDEYNHSADFVTGFDFSSAKSIIGSAQRNPGRLPISNRGRHSNSKPNMDGPRDSHTTLPDTRIPTPPLPITNSEDDIKATVEPPTESTDSKSKFRLPKFVLQDKKKLDTELRPIKIRQRMPSDNDHTHDEKLDCCPHCEPEHSRLSKHIFSHPNMAGEAFKVESADLECFLGGCPPSRANCEKQHPRRHSVNFQDPVFQKRRTPTDFRGIAEDLKRDVAKLGVSIRDVCVKSPQVIDATDRTLTELDLDKYEQPEPATLEGKFKKMPKTNTMESVNEFVSAAGDAASDNIPDPVTSSRPSEVTFSSTRPIASESIRNRASEPSFKTKSYTPSLLSGTSRTSGSRHMLLKPFVNETQPVDLGLPVPPILTPIPAEGFGQMSEVSGDQEESSPPATKLNNTTLPSEAADHLSNLRKAKELVDSVRGRIQQVEEQMLKSMVGPNVNTPSTQRIDENPPMKPLSPVESNKPATKSTWSHGLEDCSSSSEGEEKYELTVPAPDDSPLSQVNTTSTTETALMDGKAVSTMPIDEKNSAEPDLLNAAYWGFVPAVKEAVQDAVEVAVRNAVHDIVMPPGTERDQASDAYRRLMADSLAQAAQRADIYLRKASLWNHPALTPQQPSVSVTPKSPADPASQILPAVGAKGQENEVSPVKTTIDSTNASGTSRYGQIGDVAANFQSLEDLTVLPGVTSPGELETIPLNHDEKSETGEDMPGWKLSKAFKKGYTPIPSRKSSRNRVLAPKTPATNSLSRFSPNGMVGASIRKRSFERLMSKAGRGLRSVSSVGSLNTGSDKMDQEEKLLSSAPKPPPKDYSKIDGPRPRKLSRKHTVHWLRELLSSNEPYETRFTALPPRTRRDYEALDKRPRSQTAPGAPVSDLYLGKTPDPLRLDASNGKRAKRNNPSETFSKTMNDLENLMNEALFIARQAADSRDPSYAPKLLGSAVQVLKGGRKQENDAELQLRLEADRRSSRIRAFQCSVESSSAASIHESMMGSSDFSDSDYEEGELWEPMQAPSYLIPPHPPNPPSKITPLSPVKPEFTTFEPFTGSVPEKVADSRKSSGKSPRRLSQAAEAARAINDVAGETNFIHGKTISLPTLTLQGGTLSQNPYDGYSLKQHQAVASKLALTSIPNKREVHEFIMQRSNPPVNPRSNSPLDLRKQAENQQINNAKSSVAGQSYATGRTYGWQDVEPSQPQPEVRPTSGHDLTERLMDPDRRGYSHSFDGSQADHDVLDFDVGYGVRQRSNAQAGESRSLQVIELQDKPDPNLPQTTKPSNEKKRHVFSLGGKRHLSLRSQHLKGFSFTRSHRRQAIARDWSPLRKRLVATVACISTALIGILVGIYAGETPAIQYYIVDFHHYTVLGNVFFFVGLAVPSFLFWPLPLLHGRKPYILGSMSLAMPLLFPQALAVGQFRSPYVPTWRVALILSRALMGFFLGFANMNFQAILTDLFGASLQSQKPHQELVDEFDVRRHGGGMGAWLGLWTWCSVGSVGFGFMIGALIINTLPPAWGFYISIVIIAFVMLMNVLCPEVRRSAFRRSVAEVVKDNEVSRRLARGEVKMHMVQSGPKWWGEEFHYGLMLSEKMLRQPGFLVMTLYTAWIYGQNILIISLLGALMSKDYKFKSPYVGASVMSLPIGALLAIPFQKASFFSRARNMVVTSDDATLKKKVTLSSHMLRRSIFVLFLPLAGLGYTLTSGGPPIPFILPILFAGIIGFLSSLAFAECSGIIMETFDTSDLQPGMTGRPRGSSGDKTAAKRTNYSSFPRVQSAFAMCSGFGFLVAAAASGVGGALTRRLGSQAATGVMAGILLVLSVLLLAVLLRFTDVQIIPESKKDEMERYHQARRASILRGDEGAEEELWRPVIIGNPLHITRRMCLLELGSMSRFSEIRQKNKLVDEKSLEAKHPNRAAMANVRQFVQAKEHELRHKVSQSLSRNGSRGSRQSKKSDAPEQGDLGGHTEMLNRGGSGTGSRKALGSGRKGVGMATKVIKE